MNEEKQTRQALLRELAEVLAKHDLTPWQMLEILEAAKYYCAGAAAVLGWEGLKAKAYAGQTADTLLLKFIA